jgi:hypothetical protein
MKDTIPNIDKDIGLFLDRKKKNSYLSQTAVLVSPKTSFANEKLLSIHKELR